MKAVKTISNIDYKSFNEFDSFILLFGLSCIINVVNIIYQTSLLKMPDTTQLINIIVGFDILRALLFVLMFILLFKKSYDSLKTIRICLISEFSIFIIENIILIAGIGISGSVNGSSILWFIYFIYSRRVGVYFNTGKYIKSSEMDDTPVIINGMVVSDDVLIKANNVVTETTAVEPVTDNLKETIKKIHLCTLCGAPIDTINLICTGCGKKYVRRKKAPLSSKETDI